MSQKKYYQMRSYRYNTIANVNSRVVSYVRNFVMRFR